ncbi:MAG: response regulator [Planctomycetes bacterium]|nr:response regulator [Planctomycetota bacterium]
MEKRTVLFVDDEENILSSLKRGLKGEPYETFFAISGKEALEILQQNQVHVIVTDMRMPEMDGLEFLMTVKEEYPHIIRMVLSGYADIDSLLGSINQGEIFRFIPKPWKTNEVLKGIIRQSIDYYDLHSEREMLMSFVEHIIEGTEPEQVNFRLVQAIIAKHKKHLSEWKQKCHSVPLSSE